MLASSLFLVLSNVILSKSFQINRPSNVHNYHHNKLEIRLHQATSADSLSFFISALQKVSSDQATKEFYFFFFGGSGALGIGAAQVPKILNELNDLNSLKGGVSEGGENLPCNPLATFGYPEPLKTKDIIKIIKNFPTVEKIAAAGEKKSFMAQQGYLERNAFIKCLPAGTNPLAAYAAFSCFSGGPGLAAPTAATEAAARWKTGGVTAFANDLLRASATKFSAYAFFAFLIIITLDLIVESGLMAFYS